MITLREQLLQTIPTDQHAAAHTWAQATADRFHRGIAAAAQSLHETKGIELERATGIATDVVLEHLATNKPAEFADYARAQILLDDEIGGQPAHR